MRSLLVILFVLVLCGQAGAQVQYEMIDFGSNVVLDDINDLGVIVARDLNGVFLLEPQADGAYLNTPLAGSGYNLAINNQKEVVGTRDYQIVRWDSSGTYSSTGWNGYYPDINDLEHMTWNYPPEPTYFDGNSLNSISLSEFGSNLRVEARALNNGDTIAGNLRGEADIGNGLQMLNRGFTSNGDVVTFESEPYHRYTNINDQGDIVGYRKTDSVGDLFIKTGNKIIYLNGQGGTPASPEDINESGVVVGSFWGWGSELPSEAFVYHKGSGLHKLDDVVINNHQGMRFTDARVVNDSGQIIAYGKDQNNYGHSIVLKPVPYVKTHEVSNHVATRNSLPSGLQLESGKKGLIFMAHGWLGTTAPQDGVTHWSVDLKNIFEAKLQTMGIADDWQVVAYDWSDQSGFGDLDINPDQASENGFYRGVWEANKIYEKNYDQIHLIGHSAGSWLIEGITDRLRQKGDGAHIQQTFLDAYVPLDWWDQKELGDSANFSEHYFDSRYNALEIFGNALNKHVLGGVGGIVGDEMSGVFNLSVTSDDTNFKWPIQAHYWPHEWYRWYSEGTGYGLDTALALVNQPITHDTAGFERLGQSGSRPIFRGVDSLDTLNNLQSQTGSVLVSADGFSMNIGSPVWFALLVPTSEETNLVKFSLDFIDVVGSEGLLSVFWDDVLIGTVDERLILDGIQEYIFLLPSTYLASEYTLGFRLDPFADVQSEVSISNIELGYTIPEPISALVLLSLLTISFQKRKI